MPKGIKNYYYYAVHSNPNRDLPFDDESQILTQYFRTTQEVANYLGIGKTTVFSLIKNQTKNRLVARDYIIEKCNPPIRSIKTVEVDSVILS